MPKAKTNGIELEYEIFGDRSGRPLLLVMGLGSQLTGWSDEVLKQLVDEGHFVIIFDNRDMGLSSKIEEAGVPDTREMMKALSRGETITVPYTFYDMGDDAVGLLDFLEIKKAHICGHSLGGAIAETIAISHPEQLFSLILISAPTYNPNLPQPKPEITNLMRAPSGAGRAAYVEKAVQTSIAIAGSGFPLDEEWVRQMSERAYDRSYYPEGTSRQFLARLAIRNQQLPLRSINTPTLVIHGEEDPLLPVENALDAAETIAGAELMIIKGMGHYPPHRGPWPEIIKAISTHTRKVLV